MDIKNWLFRTKEQALPIEVRKQKRYIFFTVFGALQWLILALLALLAVNYSNNMAMAGLTFLFVFYCVALFRNYFSLRQVVVNSISHSFAEEGGDGEITIHMNVRKLKALYPMLNIHCGKEMVEVAFDANGEAKAIVPFSKEELGVYRVPKLRLSTRWPNGMMKTWVVLRPLVSIPVLPTSTHRSVAAMSPKSVVSTEHVRASSGDVEGVREIVKGEQGVKIAWKQTFKRNKMMTYTYEKPTKSTFIIEWPNSVEDDESKLRAIRSKISLAIRSQMSFQVIHPRYVSPVGSTESDAQRILADVMVHQLPVQEWA